MTPSGWALVAVVVVGAIILIARRMRTEGGAVGVALFKSETPQHKCADVRQGARLEGMGHGGRVARLLRGLSRGLGGHRRGRDELPPLGALIEGDLVAFSWHSAEQDVFSIGDGCEWAASSSPGRLFHILERVATSSSSDVIAISVRGYDLVFEHALRVVLWDSLRNRRSSRSCAGGDQANSERRACVELTRRRPGRAGLRGGVRSLRS